MNKKRIHIYFSCVCVCVCQRYEYIILTDEIKRMELFINLKTWQNFRIICVKLTYNIVRHSVLIFTYIPNKLLTLFFILFVIFFIFFYIFIFFMLSIIKSTLKNAFISKISSMLTDWGLPDILLLILKSLYH